MNFLQRHVLTRKRSLHIICHECRWCQKSLGACGEMGIFRSIGYGVLPEKYIRKKGFPKVVSKADRRRNDRKANNIKFIVALQKKIM